MLMCKYMYMFMNSPRGPNRTILRNGNTRVFILHYMRIVSVINISKGKGTFTFFLLFLTGTCMFLDNF